MAGLLHDVVEDTDCSIEEIQKRFGREVALLIDGVTKLGKIPYSSREEQQAENLRKMLMAMAEAVSYTHLDVYKRQPVYQTRPFSATKIPRSFPGDLFIRWGILARVPLREGQVRRCFHQAWVVLWAVPGLRPSEPQEAGEALPPRGRQPLP